MKIIGLTGSIASGKSTVAALLGQAQIPVIDADILAREVTQKGTIGLQEIVDVFGQDILNEDATLNRRALGALVFEHPNLRKKLEAILHPKIEQRRFELIAELAQHGHDICVYMAPLIFEAGLHSLLDATILVVAPMDIMIDRIMKRDHLSRDEAQKRISAQFDHATKIALADAVITNDGTLAALEEKLGTTWKAVTGKTLKGS